MEASENATCFLPDAITLQSTWKVPALGDLRKLPQCTVDLTTFIS